MTTHALMRAFLVMRAFVMFRIVHSSEWSRKLGGPGRYKSSSRADTENDVATIRVLRVRSHRTTFKTPHDRKGSLNPKN